jgi:hypothetical protein
VKQIPDTSKIGDIFYSSRLVLELLKTEVTNMHEDHGWPHPITEQTVISREIISDSLKISDSKNA